jgi:hypothetical protein
VNKIKRNIIVYHIELTRLISIALLSYYLLANLCFPQGDFSALSDLPEMYRHCKVTEDKDMTPLDFLTDHLINIDGLFDKHDNGDQQKPHAPFHFHHLQVQNYFTLHELRTTKTNISFVQNIIPIYRENSYRTNFHSQVFRPPIV